MNQIEKIQEQINKLQQELDELKNKKEVTGGRWIPEVGALYFTLDEMGDHSLAITWDDDFTDNEHFKNHNVYKTREEADEDFKFLVAYRKIRDKARELNGDWIPNWEDCSNSKYRIVFSSAYCVGCNSEDVETPGDIYFKSVDLTQQAIYELGEEVLNDFFKIK